MSKIKGYRGLFRAEYRDRKTGLRVESPIISGMFNCHGCPKHRTSGKHRVNYGTDKIKTAWAKHIDEKNKYAKPVRQNFDAEKITVRELLENYIAYARTKCKVSTITNYEDLARVHLIPEVGDEFALDFIYDDGILTRFTTKKLEGKPPEVPGYSVAHVNAMRTLLKAAFRNAHKRLSGMMPKIERLPDHAKRTGFFTDQEIMTLLANLPPCLSRAIEVLDRTGWRISEIFSRTKANLVMPENGAPGKLILEAGEAKNSEPRTFPVIPSGELEQILQEQIAATRQLESEKSISIPWLFHDNEGLPFMNYYAERGAWKPSRTFRKLWTAGLQAAKLGNRLLHDFRRTQVRRMAERGVDDAVGMSITGHKSLRIYHDYKAIQEADRLKAVETLENLSSQRKGRRKSS